MTCSRGKGTQRKTRDMIETMRARERMAGYRWRTCSRPSMVGRHRSRRTRRLQDVYRPSAATRTGRLTVTRLSAAIRDLDRAASKILLSTDGVEFRYQWCEFASECARRLTACARPTNWLRSHPDSFIQHHPRHLVAVDTDGTTIGVLSRAELRIAPVVDVVWNAIDQDEVTPGDLIQIARDLWLSTPSRTFGQSTHLSAYSARYIASAPDRPHDRRELSSRRRALRKRA